MNTTDTTITINAADFDVANAIDALLHVRGDVIWGVLTDHLEQYGLDSGRRNAFGVMSHSGNAGRAISRSTSMTSNLVADVDRSAAFQWLTRLEDEVAYGNDDVVDAMRRRGYNRLG